MSAVLCELVRVNWLPSSILRLPDGVSLSAMVEATGLSKGYCSFIKRGVKVPHERHWPALSQLARLSKPRAGRTI